MREPGPSDAGFRRITLALSAFYLAVETLYVLRLPLITDEFGNALVVYRNLHEVPYRDFTPYKTVLGHYLQLPLLVIAPSTWSGMMLVKLQAAVLTAVMIYTGARVLMRHFDPRAVLFSLGLFVVNSTFLERSGDFRVDMLTSIAGFAGFLLLLSGRHALAGLVTALSFFISQKGAYYVLGAEAALLLWAMQSREWRRVLRAALAFHVAAAAVAIAYTAFWTAIASTKAVMETVPAAATIATTTYTALPESLHALYWPQVLSRDAAFWIAALLGLIVAATRRRRRLDAIVLGYGAFILAAAVWHRQPWPYFFVIVIPTLFVAAVPAFEALIAYCTRPEKRDVRRFALALYAIGALLSLARVPAALARSNENQKRTVNALEMLLEPGDAYFAGLNVLYARPQPVPRLTWFEKHDYDFLYAAPLSQHQEYIREIEQARTKFLVRSFYIDKLPPPLRNYLLEHYDHLWSHIYVYAPKVTGGRFRLLFDGRYQLEGAPMRVIIDGREYKTGDEIALKSGWHELGPVAQPIRVKWIPARAQRLDPRYRPLPDRFIPLEFYRW